MRTGQAQTATCRRSNGNGESSRGWFVRGAPRRPPARVGRRARHRPQARRVVKACTSSTPVDLRGAHAPHVESFAAPVAGPGRRGVSWGFGPIAPHWQPRASLAGTYDARWAKERMPLLPTDFNPRFHQVAPADQVLSGYVQGGETAATLGMSPQSPLRWIVPRERPAVTVSFARRRHDLAANCDTVCIDMDVLVMTLVWRATTSVHCKLHDLDWICVDCGEGDGT